MLFFNTACSGLLLAVLLGGLLYLLSAFLSFHLELSNKLSSFESGFVPVGTIQIHFSIHYFSILIMFMVFDLEISLLVGMLMGSPGSVFVFVFVMIFIVGGVYLEWSLGKLVWII